MIGPISASSGIYSFHSIFGATYDDYHQLRLGGNVRTGETSVMAVYVIQAGTNQLSRHRSLIRGVYVLPWGELDEKSGMSLQVSSGFRSPPSV